MSISNFGLQVVVGTGPRGPAGPAGSGSGIKAALATTANITLSGEQTIDGVLTSATNVLVKNQTDQKQNGVYLSSSSTWTRVSVFSTWSQMTGSLVTVVGGNTQNGTVWLCDIPATGTVGTDNITFVEVGSGSGSGTVTSVSVTTANGVSGTVTNPTTTPAISLALGAITPSSVAASGTVTGSNLSGTNTGDQTITLTGDVTGTGTGSFVTTIAPGAVTDSKITGPVSINKLAALTASRAVVSNGSGVLTPSSTTSTELGYLSGVTSAVQTQIDSKVSKSGDTMTGLLTLSGDPSTALQAATKQYVDSLASGLNPKQACLVSTTANITLSGEQTIDGVLTSASRVLVRFQSSAAQNGIYVSSSGAWVRAADMDTWAEVPGAFTFVEQGTLYADTGWVCTSDPGGTLGSTAITWVQFAGTGTYTTDGQGIIFTGNQLSLVLDGSTLSKSASGIKVAPSGITTTEIANSAVTYAKIQNVSATDKILGRSTAGAGVVEEITCTPFARTLLDDTNQAGAQSTIGIGVIGTLSVIKAGILVNINGQGSAIVAGSTTQIIGQVPFDMTITGWQIVSNIAGSIVIDIWKSTYGTYPPVVGGSITGSQKPTLSSADKNQNLNPNTWSTSLTAGDALIFNIDSAATVTQVSLLIFATRTQ